MQLDQAALEQQGFVLVKDVFTAAECAEISTAAEILAALAPGRHFQKRYGNVRFFSGLEDDGTTSLRSVIWCALLDARLEALRRDPRLYALLRPLLGDTIRQVTNQIHVKRSGSRTSFPPHSDRSSRVRAQGEEIRNLDRCFFQTAIVAEAMGPHNGGLFFMPGSHRWSPQSAYAELVQESRRPEEDFQATIPEGCVPVHAEAGDLLIWHGDTVHGSAISTAAAGQRPLYINGYVRAADCMRGYWSWIQGQPVAMPDIEVPVLVYGQPCFDAFAPKDGRQLRALYQERRRRLDDASAA